MTEDSSNTRADGLRYSSRGNTRWIIVRGERGQRFDQWLVRHTGFSIITWQYAKASGNPYLSSLLLTTIGKRTGRLRTKVLPYYLDGDRWLVVGSNGGGPTDPDWVWNVRANDAAWIRVNRRDVAVRAHVATAQERPELFAKINSRRDSLARYQERASTFGREVPIVVLERRS
ncbi:MAG: nitroreductase/quinone reductase family protein [Acidimicrobiia bacterium]